MPTRSPTRLVTALAMSAVLLAGSALMSAPTVTALAAATLLTAPQADHLVSASFQDLTDHAPSAGSRAAWVTRLDSGSWSQAAFIANLSSSDAAVSARIAGLYRSILHRVPSPAVLATRVHDVQTGHRSLAGMAEELYASPEFVAASGGTTSAWVRALYAQILSNPSPTGAQVATWVARTASQGHLAVAQSFYASDGPYGVRVKALYRRMLHRSPSATSLEKWKKVDATRRGDLAVAQGLGTSAEYSSLAQTRSLPAFGSPLPSVFFTSPGFEWWVPESGGEGALALAAYGAPAGITARSDAAGLFLTGEAAGAAAAAPMTLAVTDATGSVDVITTSASATAPTSSPIEGVTPACQTDPFNCPPEPVAGPYLINTPVTDQLAYIGGQAPFHIVHLTPLPVGLSVSPSGAITGTPTTMTRVVVDVTVVDAQGQAATIPVSFVVDSPVPSPLPSVTNVAFGPNEMCEVAGGSLFCQGDAPNLGSRPGWSGFPMRVVGPTNVVKAVYAANGHFCLLVAAGTVSCGISPVSAFTLDPHPVPGLSGVTDLVSTHDGSTVCATASGAVSCWGDNSKGQLGAGLAPGTTPSSATPVATGLTGVASVVPELAGFCAIKTAGTLWCWGNNDKGQVGNGTTVVATSPVQVAGLAGVTSVTGTSDTVCAVASGSPWCWGYDHQLIGAVGDGGTVSGKQPTPFHITAVTGVRQLAANPSNVCALGTVSSVAGSVVCWGVKFLANGSHSVQTPTAMAGVSGATQIANQGVSPCALVSAAVKCWGQAPVGDGTANGSDTPVTATGLSGVTQIFQTGSAVCAVEGTGGIWCWGRNFDGTVGAGVGGQVNTPTQLTGLDHITGVVLDQIVGAAPAASACVISNVGHLTCWGNNQGGQIDSSSAGGPRYSPFTL